MIPSSVGFSLRVLVLARTNPCRLKPTLLKPGRTSIEKYSSSSDKAKLVKSDNQEAAGRPNAKRKVR
jgi:hypothetical protein